MKISDVDSLKNRFTFAISVNDLFYFIHWKWTTKKKKVENTVLITCEEIDLY